ncbi:signal peptide peptidase SppA [Colwellia psychrerythraea]|uniref:Signal peptide peptidase SppA, 67K type n=1 Tax=Colwellia psychrerythraea (strain 34H / ATCC BAA-681) TaxID=167879 RepID=Q481G9_COLP3|nr:signal peptide peptidase SppA [Colwellia psychrerythraea]AAZ25111.1 signal peptide peptidase SppA, 67K type [Colwellia psychrerythraea 34H]
MNNNPGIIKRIFSSIWRVLTFTRSVVLNLVFFILLFSFIGVILSSGEEQVTVPEKTALVLNLVGDVVEQKREVDPMEAFLSEAMEQQDDKPEVLLTDIIDVISKAKKDDRVEILVLQLQGLNRAGLTKLQDIAAALEDFKSSGKQIIALGDQFSQDQYYLASTANDIWLNPQGFMLLDGYGRYNMYFKSALEKLAINQHIFRVGTFKSAVEPFIRDDMSDAAKKANKLWLADLWMQYKEDVAARRGFGVDNFDENIDNLVAKFSAADSSFAQYALKNNWVDQLKSRQEMRSELIELVGENKKGDSYNHIGYKNYIAATSSSIEESAELAEKSHDKVAIIVAKGTILDGTQKPGTIGGDSTAKLLRKARNNDDVKAVVLRVDSPGGSAYASEIIRQEVELLKKAGKPVVASMGTYAASGGYWISAPADKIYAAPSTITGSIGIFGMMMTFEDTLSKMGIYTDGVGTTDIAGFSPTQALTPGMANLFQLSINRGYQEFIQLVATNRDMTLEEVDAIAQGRVWSGKKAKELGLVDELGNLTDAVVAAATLAKLEQYDTLLIEKEQSSRNKIMQQLLGQSSTLVSLFSANEEKIAIDLATNSVNSKPLSQFITMMKNELGLMNQFNDPQGRYTLCVACGAN